MMKKNYISPCIVMQTICQQHIIMTSNFNETDNDKLPSYPDDPQDPGNALSRQRSRSLWDEEEDDVSDY